MVRFANNAASYGAGLLLANTDTTTVDEQRLGGIDWSGYTGDGTGAGTNTEVYNRILAFVTDATGGTEDSRLDFYTMSAGTSTNVMSISSGNVGIGTTDPSAPLHLSATTGHLAYLRGSTANGYNDLLILNDQNTTSRAIQIGYSGSSYSGAYWTGGNTGEVGAVGTTGAYPLTFGTSNTQRMIITSSGNVGIGTTNPNEKLDIRDGKLVLSDSDIDHGMTGRIPTDVYGFFYPRSATLGGLAIEGDSDGDSYGLDLAGIIGSTNPTDTIAAILLTGAKKNTTDAQALGSGETVLQINNYTTSLMTVMGNGNLGIGTTNPGFLLDVAGGARQQQTVSWSFGGGAASDDQPTKNSAFYSQYGNYAVQKGQLYAPNGTYYGLIVGTSTANPWFEYKIGGTNISSIYVSATAANWADSSERTEYISYSVDNGANYTTLCSQTWTSGSDSCSGTISLSQSSSVLIKFGMSGTAPSYMVGWSNVTIKPTATSFAFMPGYNLTSNGAVYSNNGEFTNTNPSDLNLKYNINSLGNSLTQITQLRPVSFNWKSDGTTDYGFIAQEVESILPELVRTDQRTGMKGLLSIEFIPYLTKAIQDQQAIINDLNSRVANLEASSSGGLDDLVAEASTSSANTFSSIEITESLRTMDATISGTFKALGESFLGNTTIAGDLIVDGTLSFTGNSISSIGTLFLQNGPLDTLIDIFNGKVQIDNSGKVSMQKLAVSSDVLGTATIPAGEDLIVIDTETVTTNSKILVTPTTPTGKQSLIVSQKDPGVGFTVSLEETYSEDIEFDWFIIDTN